ncbi:MAG: ABC transporter substrate-binding protein [Fretibacterium sp.]|nr:ABC transporter substrate-binding protein [Fretibacterium sp.]
MKKITAALVAALTFLIVPPVSAGEKVAGFPVTVTDQTGRSVTLNAPAQRIVSGYYISSSTCLALGLKDRLVAVEEKIDTRPIYKLSAPELIGSVGNVGSAKNFDLEACLAAKPDLVILPKRAKDYAATLAEMDIPTIIVNPENHKQLVEMISLIAKLTDTEPAAQKLIAHYDEVEAKVRELTSGIPDEKKPLVYMCGPSSYLVTAPREMYQASLVASAGGKNAGDILDGDSWTKVSYEQLLAMNPDVIIIPTNNMANAQPNFTATEIMADKNLAEIKAVQNEAVFNMPVGFEAWDSPVPSGILGMLWMVSTLHPEAYSLEAFAADAADFYRAFYGFEMDTSGLVNKN